MSITQVLLFGINLKGFVCHDKIRKVFFVITLEVSKPLDIKVIQSTDYFNRMFTILVMKNGKTQTIERKYFSIQFKSLQMLFVEMIENKLTGIQQGKYVEKYTIKGASPVLS